MDENKKISEEVLKQIELRKQTINVTNQLLNHEFKIYVNGQLQDAGYDLNYRYSIDEKTGVVTLVEDDVIIEPANKE